MIGAYLVVGVLWLALSLLLAISLREQRPYVRPAENNPIWTWPLGQ